jgi:hypothetical protein
MSTRTGVKRQVAGALVLWFVAVRIIDVEMWGTNEISSDAWDVLSVVLHDLGAGVDGDWMCWKVER